jgi:transposase
MHRFIDGEDRRQPALLPHCLEDYVSEENPVRVIEVFIDELDLTALGFSGVTPAPTGRPAYHPSTLLKIYLYGYSTAFGRAGGWNAKRSAMSS